MRALLAKRIDAHGAGRAVAGEPALGRHLLGQHAVTTEAHGSRAALATSRVVAAGRAANAVHATPTVRTLGAATALGARTNVGPTQPEVAHVCAVRAGTVFLAASVAVTIDAGAATQTVAVEDAGVACQGLAESLLAALARAARRGARAATLTKAPDATAPGSALAVVLTAFVRTRTTAARARCPTRAATRHAPDGRGSSATTAAPTRGAAGAGHASVGHDRRLRGWPAIRNHAPITAGRERFGRHAGAAEVAHVARRTVSVVITVRRRAAHAFVSVAEVPRPAVLIVRTRASRTRMMIDVPLFFPAARGERAQRYERQGAHGLAEVHGVRETPLATLRACAARTSRQTLSRGSQMPRQCRFTPTRRPASSARPTLPALFAVPCARAVVSAAST